MLTVFGVNSGKDNSTHQQQQQQEQHRYQMMQYAAEREHDPDEVVADFERTVLDFFNSDLNLEISRDGSVSREIYNFTHQMSPHFFSRCLQFICSSCASSFCVSVVLSKPL